MTEYLLLTLAAFAAGALNAVAGGGSFLTLPALIYCGVPPVIANATGTVALLPGYAASTWGFRQALRELKGLALPRVLMLSVLGGSLGAGLLLVTDNHTFNQLMPWLLLAATALFALAPRLLASRQGRSASPMVALAALTVVAIYGGYFNGGLGILLLAALSLLGHSNLNAMNGVKNLLSTVLTAIAVMIYALGDLVLWPQALLMMLTATAGGYWGARVAQRLPAGTLRLGIIAVGLAMSLIFFLRL